ncbi:methyltransferase family protein [Budvicia aquatica]|uniref:Isoprenylcysteine carboxylmethyltransferase family protein n=1 Tax=Budvicia aquatica TaxID=82979 RepID=A0A2C6DS16_9GAMM|nr:isoprenylcysteine carboxylmethyltransferase family protein [Budvicia aquatica]PHI31493.1 isoprenylcysteine carboxylmethyltransferase family protein [Budvicia aquatica]
MTFSRLERLIPPVIVFAFSILLIWLLNFLFPMAYTETAITRLVCALSFLAAGVIGVLSLMAFFKAGTTVNPVKVNTATTLVDTGLYAYSRNPMYLALALLLISFSAYLVNPLGILGVAFFVCFITLFQIIPEERALMDIFGERYQRYCQRVRRWI